jgi:hypothetical protein
MNADLIDLYRCIQHRRGEWRVGDRVIHDLYGPGIVAGADDSLRLNVTFTDCKIEPLQGHEAELLWLPHVWSDDGRCLIGMIERDFSVTRIWYDSDDLTTDDGWIYGVDFIDGEFIGYYNSLPEALLRAIKEQEGKG